MTIKDLNIDRMLPFLGDEELKALAKEAIEGAKNDHEENMRLLLKLAPFIGQDEVDVILYDLLDRNIPFEPLAPFASPDFFTTLVDLFLEGRAENVNIDALYPFMDEKDIKRLFAAVIKQRELDRQEAAKLFETEKAEAAKEEENPEEREEPEESEEPEEHEEPEESEEPEEHEEHEESEESKYGSDWKVHVLDTEELMRSVEEKVKKRLFARFFGRNTDISEEVKKEFESAMEKSMDKSVGKPVGKPVGK